MQLDGVQLEWTWQPQETRARILPFSIGHGLDPGMGQGFDQWKYSGQNLFKEIMKCLSLLGLDPSGIVGQIMDDMR